MLALSRKKNEALVINNNVEVTILDIKGDQVKVGITAPKEVPVYRKEVYLQIQEANKDAFGSENVEALKDAFSFGDITYSYEEDKQSWWKYRIQGDVPPWMYYVKFEGMSEEEAKAMVEEAQPKEPTLFGGEE